MKTGIIPSSVIPSHAVSILLSSGDSIDISTTHNLHMKHPVYQGVLLSRDDAAALSAGIKNILSGSSRVAIVRSSLFNHDTLSVSTDATAVVVGVKQRSEPMLVTISYDDLVKVLQMLEARVYDLSSPVEKMLIGVERDESY